MAFPVLALLPDPVDGVEVVVGANPRNGLLQEVQQVGGAAQHPSPVRHDVVRSYRWERERVCERPDNGILLEVWMGQMLLGICHLGQTDSDVMIFPVSRHWKTQVKGGNRNSVRENLPLWVTQSHLTQKIWFPPPWQGPTTETLLLYIKPTSRGITTVCL